MLKRLILNIAFLTMLTVISAGQEVLIGLQSNRQVKENFKKPFMSKRAAFADTLSLPFFDDFSDPRVTPSPERWSDNFVFINNTYSVHQPTVGIATFDAIDNSGSLYESASLEGFEADHLTSKPINLAYPSSDNIYLSFFYEPGGLGEMPGIYDSLTVQFYAPDEALWYSAWKSPDTIIKRFQPAVIKIDNPRFLKKGFKFRFVNWATLSREFYKEDPAMVGNCDMWNIDYVYLDRNRNESDTTIADVAFRTPVRSLLKTHESMPWKQFRAVYLQEMGSSIPIHYRNNDTIVRNVTRNFVIRDVYRNTVAQSFSAGATNIDPLTNVDYNAGLIYTFNTTGSDSALFNITCYLITDDFDPKNNDTIRYNQVFSNYFAFDDGTSEAGYGINGQGSRNAMVAYRFKSYTNDTVRAISICFNDSYLNTNRRAFDLMIWDDVDELPGNVLYTLENVIVEPEKSLNGFYTYVLPEGVEVNGTFYVGWRQRSETFLNAGFDVNTSNGGRQLYWLNGDWFQTQMQGSLMIRPVVGQALKTTSIKKPPPETQREYRLWPNPATDYINLDCSDLALASSARVIIIDLQGRELLNVPYNARIGISELKPGIYTVVTTIHGRRTGHLRFVKII